MANRGRSAGQHLVRRAAVIAPRRGEIWLADLRPTRGRKQSGRRPVLVLSIDAFNAGPAELIVVLPLTSMVRHIPLHVRISIGDGGVRNDSAILCEAIRSVTKERLISKCGAASREVMDSVADLAHSAGAVTVTARPTPGCGPS